METEKSFFKVNVKTFFYVLFLSIFFAFTPLLAIGCGFSSSLSVVCAMITPIAVLIITPLKTFSVETYTLPLFVVPIIIFSILLSYVVVCAIRGLFSQQKLKAFWLVSVFVLAYLLLATVSAKISNARSAAQIVPPIVLLPPIQ
ncbi:MAG: hypothetical protein WCO79_00760 [bacterium]